MQNDLIAKEEGYYAALRYLGSATEESVNMIRLNRQTAERIDKKHRKIFLPSIKTQFPEVKPLSEAYGIIETGLALGLTLSQMRDSCPHLNYCPVEVLASDRKQYRLQNCHNPQQFRCCGANVA